MKKFLVVLLSLGLLVAFGATASAADVKFGGSYYVVGVYENNPLLSPDEIGQSRYSRAFFYQRIRLQPVFQIAEGLTFTARMDAMEKQWGNTNWKGGTDDLTSSRRNQGALAQSQKIQESLEFERGYVTFMTRIGMFQVGYQNVDDWGTDYSDFSNSRPRFAYITKAGPVEIAFTYEKLFENDTAGVPAANTHATDRDYDTYAISGTYKGKGLEAGLLYKYYVNNSGAEGAAATAGVKQTVSQIAPYAKATFGPVYLEGELQYWFGKGKFEQPAAGFGVVALPQDVDISAWGAYIKGRFNFGPAYAGALFSYASGDDLKDADKSKMKPGGAGTNFAPALIMMNDALNTWENGTGVAAPVSGRVTTEKDNTLIYNIFAGVNPTPKLNIEAALTYATVDKKALARAAGGVVLEAGSDKIGTEFDIKATYKIYDNLSYMVGAGYLWAGDYFKSSVVGGAVVERNIDNDYILLNQLTLAF
ncbi:MAG: alginate export family protein [Deltaproteobacteria bacterium]|nr:alginate export family protein [Deltaproteobacteria bacterium]